MKANEVDIFFVSSYPGSDKDYWQNRWECKLSTARRVEQAEWSKPVCEDWVRKTVSEVQKAERPVVLVAHSLGVPTALHAVACLGQKLCGGFFVAPPDIEKAGGLSENLRAFGPYPRMSLPFPSVVIASRNDLFGNFEKAEALANDWHSLFLDAGEAGSVNAQSGHGPWPEGLMVFAQFLAKL